jgi:FkbM family methyltransferase
MLMRIALNDHGKRIQLELADPEDHISRRILRRRDWYEKDLLEDVFGRHPQGLAIDVGAHIGNHTAWLSGVCGLNVLAFEPNPDTRAQLERNVKLNGLQNKVRVIGAAAGAAPARARLEILKDGNSGMVRAITDAAGDLDVVTIDSLDLHDVALIKIDVEGAEVAILQGAVETLKRCRPLLYVEAEGAERKEAVERFLEPLGYACFGQYALTPTYGFRARKPVNVVLSATIMAHPLRQRFVAELIGALDGPATITWDRVNERWETGRRSLLAFDPDATHHLVLQDDAVVCRDVLAGARAAVAEQPDVPISLYLGKQRPHGAKFTQLMKIARDRGDRWISFGQLCWGVAIILPVELIGPIVAFGDQNPQIHNYDMRISRWLEQNRIEIRYTVPSLVDHRRQAESPSLISENGRPRTGANRVAHWFIGRAVSALAGADPREELDGAQALVAQA